jgi:hypothetical protein
MYWGVAAPAVKSAPSARLDHETDTNAHRVFNPLGNLGALIRP